MRRMPPAPRDLKPGRTCEHDRENAARRSIPLHPPARRRADREAVSMMRTPRTPRSLLLTCVAGLIWGGATRAPAAPPDAPDRRPGASRPIDYARDVRPILEARCYDCHGPKKQKAGLRLD